MSVSKREAILDGLDIVILSAINGNPKSSSEILLEAAKHQHWAEYKPSAMRQRISRLVGRGLITIAKKKKGEKRLQYKATEQGLAALRDSLTFYRSV